MLAEERKVLPMTAKGDAVSAENPHLRSYPPNEVMIQEDTPNDSTISILKKGTLGVFKGAEESTNSSHSQNEKVTK